MITKCHRLDLEIAGPQLVMPSNLPATNIIVIPEINKHLKQNLKDHNISPLVLGNSRISAGYAHVKVIINYLSNLG